jgi:uncharacterized protein
MNPATAVELADWRRATAALYARVREQAGPAAAHALWRDGRDRMMRSHPQSPLPPTDPMRGARLAVRRGSALGPACPVSLASAAARDRHRRGWRDPPRANGLGAVPDPAGWLLALWRLDQYAGGLFLLDPSRPCSDTTAARASDPTSVIQARPTVLGLQPADR